MCPDLPIEYHGNPLTDQMRHAGLTSLSKSVLNQHDQNQTPTQFPESLLAFRIGRSKRLQKLAMKVLAFIQKDQRAYNLRVTQTFEQVLQLQKIFEQDIHHLRKEIHGLKKSIQANQDTHQTLYKQLAAVEHHHRLTSLSIQNELSVLKQSSPAQGSPRSEDSSESNPSAQLSQPMEREIPPSLESLFLSVQAETHQYPEEVKKRFPKFLPYLKNAKVGNASSPILDLECGNGDWLQFLTEQGLTVQGTESRLTLFQHCQSLQLNVIHLNPLAVLQDTPAQSLGAITAFHLMQNLTFSQMVEFLTEALRVLKPGGVLLLENLNPKNLNVLRHDYWLNPSFRQLIPSDFLQALMKLRGFQNIQIFEPTSYSEKDRILGGPVADHLNDMFYCSPTYALVGYSL